MTAALRRRDTPERRYRLALIGAFGVAVLLRVPATVQELPPFSFCDESIFSSEVTRMLTEQQWVTREFRSGGFNIYPMLLIGHAMAAFGVLDPTSLVVVGRWFYAVLIASATVFLVAGAARRLSGRRTVGLIAAGLFLLSPSLLAVSRYWYPDHYAVFFAAAIVYFAVRLLTEPGSTRRRLGLVVLLGAALGAALSVKYTFSVAAAPVGLTLLAGLRRPADGFGPRVVRTLVEVLAAGASASVVAVGVDFSALVEPNLFRDGFLFNIQNYSRPGGGPNGIGFYAFLLLVAALGVLGLVGLVVGVISTARPAPMVLVVLLCFPLLNIVYLGLQGLVFNRNIIASVPFLLPLIAIGIGRLLRRRPSRARTRIAVIGVALATALQLAQVGTNAISDLRPDSEPVAAAWVTRNVPTGTVVGTNGNCSASPALAAGFETKDDPFFTQGLDYYVVNSYWDSALNPAFRGSAAAWAILDQKYLHYYFASDRNLPQEVFALPWPTVDVRRVAPAGYSVAKVFESNGPAIVVLRRAG